MPTIDWCELATVLTHVLCVGFWRERATDVDLKHFGHSEECCYVWAFKAEMIHIVGLRKRTK